MFENLDRRFPAHILFWGNVGILPKLTQGKLKILKRLINIEETGKAGKESYLKNTSPVLRVLQNLHGMIIHELYELLKKIETT